ncbi:unnamed protein product [Dibothriocephalus latus]|uniref:Uncharacterized protein n=1 Tax=Dibothriocephalus latus TaxID=60516 RepID=A0A3P6TKL5_DIBLA|nr:unnamed protein product [Dibothriocephalus latus]
MPAAHGALSDFADEAYDLVETVKRLKLSREASSNDIVRFLDTLADNNPLEYLDITECTLKETDTSTLLRLLWNTKERFTLVINPSCLKQSLSDIESFADRKSSLSNFEVSKAKEDTNRMTIKIWRKLSSSIARLQLRIPAENFGYLSTHLPDADIAKNAIEEYRTTPALHFQLLDSALDPSVLAKAQKSVENKLKEALQVALKETAKNTIESIFNELKITHGREFCSVRPKEQELNQKVDPIIQAACGALQEQVGEIVEPMILNVNAKLAQQMYTYILETITADVDQCLLKLPTRSKLLCRSSTISDPCEYVGLTALLAPVSSVFRLSFTTVLSWQVLIYCGTKEKGLTWVDVTPELCCKVTYKTEMGGIVNRNRLEDETVCS